MLNKKYILLSLAIILICCSAWGFLTHKTINQLSIYALPVQLQEFFFTHQDYLVNEAIRPDLRRNIEDAEGPRHFIDLDVYGKDAINEFPEEYDAAVALVSEDTLIKYGILPWTVVWNYKKLTSAFRSRNVDSILFYAADLGHYIGDAHVPLHTTLNYDGQLTGQKGIHSLWETKVPEEYFDIYRFHFPKVKYVGDPLKRIWQVIRESHLLVDDVLVLESSLGNDLPDSLKYVYVERNGSSRRYYTDEFIAAYGLLVNNMVNEQIVRSAEVTADFWYSAWTDAGKPELKGMYSLDKAQKVRLAEEISSWQQNELQQKQLIIGEKE